MTIEVTAKKPEDAIKQGLEQLGATLDEVEVEVLESGGLFRKAKVRLTIERDEQEKAPVTTAPQASADRPESKDKGEKAEKSVKEAKPEKAEKNETQKAQNTQKSQRAQKPQKAEKNEKSVADGKGDKSVTTEKTEKTEKTTRAEKAPKHTREEEAQALEHACEFVKNVIAKMGFEAGVALNNENGMIEIDAPAGDDALIIGRHGETLSALSYIAETAERAEKFRIGVAVDCNGYRARRAASLSAMARRRADECVKKNRRIKLESMDRADRRTIHFALADDDRVTTASEGKEPHRYIVIAPKK